MSRFSKQVDLLVTSLILMCVGLLFLFLNQGLNTYLILHFSLLMIFQSLLILIMAALSIYREFSLKQLRQKGQEETAQIKENVDSVNATMLLIVVVVLVVGFYMFTMKLANEGAGIAAPIHMVVCVLVFILFSCVEKWWALKLKQLSDASSICNLMVLDRVATALLFLDMVMSFTGLFKITQYADYVMIALWVYAALSALISVAIKVLRHGNDMEFSLYVLLPFYTRGGIQHSGALEWLEENTGISMRSLWSLQFLKETLPLCGLGVVAVLWLSTCFVQIEAYEQGALYRFGRLREEDILEPGLHVKLPIPFETAEIYDVSHAKTMIVGYEGDTESKNNLWTMAHDGEEQQLLLGAGRELVAINLKVIYKINDLHDYLTNYSSPESALNAKGYEIVMHHTVDTDINTIISEDRSILANQIEAELVEYAREAELGLEVMSVTLASIHPPITIANVYQNVVSAGIQKKAVTLTAEGEAMVAREQAQADKQVAVNDAGIARDERVSAAKAEVTEYNASIEAYQIDPEGYELNRYLDSVQKALAGRKKYLVGEGVELNHLYSGASAWVNGILSGAAENNQMEDAGGKDGQG